MDFIKILTMVGIFGLFIMGGIALFSDSVAQGNIELDSRAENLNNSLTRIAEVIDEDYVSLGENQKDTLEEQGVTDDDAFDRIIKGAQTALNQITGLFRITNTIVVETFSFIKLPKYFETIFFSIILFAIVMSLIYMGFRFQLR